MARRRNSRQTTVNVVEKKEIIAEAPKQEIVEEVAVKETWFGDEMDNLIHKQAEKVGLEKAIMLMQRLLDIKTTGKVNDDTLTAYNSYPGRKDFQASYRDLM